MNLSQEAESSNNVSETSHSSTSRKARNKNVITAESEVSIPQISNSTNVTEAMILDSPASSQTRPIAYKINPFFRDLFLRPTPATPQNMTDISMDSDTSRGHNTSAELKDDETRRMAYNIEPFFRDLFFRTTPATPKNMTDISMDSDTSRGQNNTSAELTDDQTRRKEYKIYPFFQDLFLRTTPATPQNMTDISMDADTSRGHNNTSAGLKDDQTRRMTYKIDPFFQDLFLRTAPSTSRNMTDISIDSDTSRGHNNTSAELKDDQTRPIAYKINPTLQDMFLRTTPETPQNMTDISMDSDTSRGHSNTSPELIDDQNFTVSQPSDESDDLSSLKFSSTRILSQQLSTRETKEVSFLFENPEVNGTPASFIQHKVPETFTNNSVLQYLAKTFTVSASTIAPHNTEQTSTPPVNISVDEIKGDLTNTVHIHVLDPRRMFFIPEMDKNMTEADNYDFQRGNMTLLFVHVPLTSDNGNQSVMHFRAEATVTEGRNPNCVRCHPSFLLPGTCHPCVIIR
jgi:hypothetical protein